MKIAAAVEYCGSKFNGWQRLKEGRSVQHCVEQAFSFVADQPILVTCAGRTDARVHARFQIIHFETEVNRDMHSWVFGANANLPDDVSILWAQAVNDDFHARFQAQSRAYTYIILNRPARSGLFSDLVTWEYRSLDEKRMSRAATYLQGKHDFTSYRAQACQAHTAVREILSLQVRRHNDFVMIEVRANAFLYHMVRNIAGVLMTIGTGKEDVGWAKDVLEARDRAAGGITALPNGLYLMDVVYPERFNIPVSKATLDFLPLDLSTEVNCNISEPAE